MVGRTENDIKNRWNSIVRRPLAPSGRGWLPDENALRARYLGMTLEQLDSVNALVAKVEFFFKDSKRMDTVVCETDLVPEDDERALFEGGDRVKIYIASANVGNAAIKEMDTWLPVNAPHTDVGVAA